TLPRSLAGLAGRARGSVERKPGAGGDQGEAQRPGPALLDGLRQRRLATPDEQQVVTALEHGGVERLAAGVLEHLAGDVRSHVVDAVSQPWTEDRERRRDPVDAPDP